MKSLYKIAAIGSLCSLLLSVLFSCEDDLPGVMDTTSQMTELKAIKIVNVGEAGNGVVEGTINEVTKEVSFPRLDTLTDFEHLRFEALLSDGAKLDQETYSVVFEEGKTEKVIVLKVQNDPRYREYLVKLRLNVPVFGAEFSTPIIYDYSSNPLGNPIYATFTGQLTRGTGFDGEHVLIVSRSAFSVTDAHLLKVSDLKNNTINRINLNVGNVAAGSLVVSGGAQINGHTYVANISGAAASPLKIYHWTDPTQLPEVTQINMATVPGAGTRHGDNVSFNLDQNGNGYIFYNSDTGPVLRLKVSNYSQITEPTVLSVPFTYGQWSSYLQIGNTESYLITSYTQPVSVISSSGSISYSLGASSIPKGSDARVIEFNGERYLMMISVARGPGDVSTLYLYNITKGNSITDALSSFEESDKQPIYQYNLSTIPNGAPASQTGFKVIKDGEGNDSVLQLFAAAADAGFVIIEVPKKQLEEEE
ncbi:DUF4623 domain-containing protein [Sphingobacterium arenae]|uniref:DUF4623 domain-containing protein n=1 Tax=Sphingobacterium arenae TaxID=1280598 RepID=A0ABR7Y804_9SPHI|nr:DUF4623 domain-containing protein [Sphingobacterium arenae]MBD1427441.1 DUF4623 domain-containing protein [Sphingobacterium arenae]